MADYRLHRYATNDKRLFVNSIVPKDSDFSEALQRLIAGINLKGKDLFVPTTMPASLLSNIQTLNDCRSHRVYLQSDLDARLRLASLVKNCQTDLPFYWLHLNESVHFWASRLSTTEKSMRRCQRLKDRCWALIWTKAFISWHVK